MGRVHHLVPEHAPRPPFACLTPDISMTGCDVLKWSILDNIVFFFANIVLLQIIGSSVWLQSGRWSMVLITLGFLGPLPFAVNHYVCNSIAVSIFIAMIGRLFDSQQV